MEKPLLKDNHTSEDVEKYLKELAIFEKIENKNKRPEPLNQINVQLILKSCEQYLDYLNSNEYHEDNDYPHYMFEDMLQAVYGKNIGSYIRNLTK